MIEKKLDAAMGSKGSINQREFAKLCQVHGAAVAPAKADLKFMREQFMGESWWLSLAKHRSKAAAGKYVQLLAMQLAFKLSHEKGMQNDVKIHATDTKPQIRRSLVSNQGFSNLDNE